MVTTGILPHKEKLHDRAGNRTRDLVISSQKFWPLDHEAGQIRWDVYQKVLRNFSNNKYRCQRQFWKILTTLYRT